MNRRAVTLRNKCILEKAIFAQAQQKECLFVPFVEELAALFCTGRQPELYDASAVESLTSAVERPTPCNGKLVFTRVRSCGALAPAECHNVP